MDRQWIRNKKQIATWKGNAQVMVSHPRPTAQKLYLLPFIHHSWGDLWIMFPVSTLLGNPSDMDLGNATCRVFHFTLLYYTNVCLYDKVWLKTKHLLIVMKRPLSLTCGVKKSRQLRGIPSPEMVAELVLLSRWSSAQWRSDTPGHSAALHARCTGNSSLQTRIQRKQLTAAVFRNKGKEQL